jgi:imidazolonepropionase
MRRVTLVRGARQLLTLHGPNGPRRGADLRNLGLIQDGSVLIVDGLIADAGPSRRVENLALARQAKEIDATGRLVMPGFVDSHTQLVAGPARGGTLAVARTIQELSPRTLQAHARRAVEEAVRHGTTTLESKSGFGLIEANEIKILRIHTALEKQNLRLVSTFLAAHVSPEYQDRPDEYLEWICLHLLPLVYRRKLAEFADIRCSEEAFTVEQARRYLAAAQQTGFALKMQTGQHSHAGAIRMAIQAGVVSVDRLTDVTPEDAALLAQSPILATLLPGEAFHLGTHRYAPARTLIDSGAAVVLASNYNPETCPSQNLQMTIALACREMSMTPAEALAAVTINAAYALRRADRIGSLEAGKSADLLILSVPDYREIPYHFGVNLVELVMKGGTVLVQRSEVKWPAN